jgi:hypothetical protein
MGERERERKSERKRCKRDLKIYFLFILNIYFLLIGSLLTELTATFDEKLRLLLDPNYQSR